jgi:hypothetical protein
MYNYYLSIKKYPKYFGREETLTHPENKPLQQDGICYRLHSVTLFKFLAQG